MIGCEAEPYAALLHGDWSGRGTDEDGVVHTILASLSYDAEDTWPLTGQAAFDGGFLLPVVSASSDVDSAEVELTNQLQDLALTEITVDKDRMTGSFAFDACADDGGCPIAGSFGADRR